MHRITLTEQHYDLVRRFMVVHKLPNARAATQQMIEVAASARGRVEGITVVEEVDDYEADQEGRRDNLLAPAHA